MLFYLCHELATAFLRANAARPDKQAIVPGIWPALATIFYSTTVISAAVFGTPRLRD